MTESEDGDEAKGEDGQDHSKEFANVVRHQAEQGYVKLVHHKFSKALKLLFAPAHKASAPQLLQKFWSRALSDSSAVIYTVEAEFFQRARPVM
jgi:hypothetical protein